MTLLIVPIKATNARDILHNVIIAYSCSRASRKLALT